MVFLYSGKGHERPQSLGAWGLIARRLPPFRHVRNPGTSRILKVATDWSGGFLPPCALSDHHVVRRNGCRPASQSGGVSSCEPAILRKAATHFVTRARRRACERRSRRSQRASGEAISPTAPSARDGGSRTRRGAKRSRTGRTAKPPHHHSVGRLCRSLAAAARVSAPDRKRTFPRLIVTSAMPSLRTSRRLSTRQLRVALPIPRYHR